MFNISSLNKSFKFSYNYLLKGDKKYTGAFITNLKSGKTIRLEYENGLLKSSFLGVSRKIYEYDDYNRLINVKKNNKDIFVKEIKHNIGIEYTRQETINNVIGRTYNKDNKLIRYAISPKLLFGFIKYIRDISIDTRYFLNKAKYLGDGHIQLKNLQGDFILNNGVIDKTIVKNNKNGLISVIISDGKNYKGICKNPKNKFGSVINYTVDKNGNPIWTRINDINDKWHYDKKVKYDDFGHKMREIFSEGEGKWFTENSFDINGNIILTRKLSSSGQTIQTTKFKFNKNNKLIKENVYNKNNKLVEQTINKYYRKNNSLKSSEVTYYDSMGSYKNLYEYDKENHLYKFSEIYDELKCETFYDKNDCIIKYIEKNNEGKIKYTKEYINNGSECVETIVKDATDSIKYRIEHSKKIKKSTQKNINTFKTSEGKLIGKEFIIYNNKTEQTNCIYTDAQGKRIKYDVLCKLLGYEV